MKSNNKIKKIITTCTTFEYRVKRGKGKVVVDDELIDGEPLVWVEASYGQMLELTLTEAELLVEALKLAVEELKK